MTFTARSADGRDISYVDHKRHLYLFSLFLPLVPALSAVLFFAAGKNVLMTLVPVAFVFGFIPLMDWVFGEDTENPPEDVVEAMAADNYYRVLAHLSVPFYWISFVATAVLVGTQGLPWWSVLALAVGAGTVSGGCITTGHELGHKNNPLDRFAAKICNAVIGYGHFCIEHNRGHHVYVSTPEDPASSRMGESIYKFARRELPGAFRRGWEQESLRLSRRGKSAWSIENEILQGYGLTLVVAFAFAVAFGWVMVPFILIHHFFGWYGLTQANYVEHYGLLREKKANGRYAPCEPHHSWNTNHIFSNLLTFHLQRHSDHHANPQRPYQALRDFVDLPRLPSGYPGMYAIAAIPPLWFKIMDPKVMAWAGGDLSKVNVDPDAADRLRTRYATAAG